MNFKERTIKKLDEKGLAKQKIPKHWRNVLNALDFAIATEWKCPGEKEVTKENSKGSFVYSMDNAIAYLIPYVLVEFERRRCSTSIYPKDDVTLDFKGEELKTDDEKTTQILKEMFLWFKLYNEEEYMDYNSSLEEQTKQYHEFMNKGSELFKNHFPKLWH